MAVTLYSSGCPQCKVLKKKLEDKKIPFEYIEDTQLMIDKGFQSAPQLEIDGLVYTFSAARKLVDSFDNENTFEQFVTNQVSE